MQASRPAVAAAHLRGYDVGYRVGGQTQLLARLQQRKEEILMARTGIRKTALSLAVAGTFAGGVSQAHASAFALIEQSASGLGNSYAGAAATAEDASTIFYNPPA